MADAHETFDPTPYVRRPIADVATAVGLTARLLRLVPSGAGAEVKRRARELRSATSALQKAWAQVIEARPEDRRPADLEVDHAWGGVHARLEAYGNLPAAAFPRAARAGEILELLFPDGMTFLQLPYEAEWAESEKRLRRIAERRLEPELVELCGQDFVAYLKSAHEQYGRILGTTAPRLPAETAPTMAEPLRRVTQAISRYALQVAATVDETRPETVRAARAALSPLDEHRARSAASAAGPAASDPAGGEPGAPSPVTPLPDVK
jgi:hypothetical protein